MYWSFVSFRNFPTILPSSIEKLLFYYARTWAGARVYCITFLCYLKEVHLVSECFVDDAAGDFKVELQVS